MKPSDETIAGELKKWYPSLPEHLLEGCELLLDRYPSMYEPLMEQLTNLNTIFARLWGWKQNQLKDLGFQLRKLEREYKDEKHDKNIPLHTAKELLTSKTQHAITTREKEVNTFVEFMYLQLELLLNIDDARLRTKIILLNTLKDFRDKK